MVSGRRLVSTWFALSLSIGTGLQGISSTVGQETGSTTISVVIGVAGAFITAYLLLQLYPEIESDFIWRFSGFTFVLFVVGNALIDGGIYAPPEKSSPLLISILWMASLAFAYGVTLLQTNSVNVSPR